MSTKKSTIPTGNGSESKTDSNGVKLMTYQIFVKTRSKVILPDHISGVAKKHLKLRNAQSGVFEVEVVSQDRIRRINKEFRSLDKPTDVLSFPVAEFPGREKLYGTIFLCSDIIKLNAKESGKTFKAEFDFILTHGLDHLLGIHHK